MAKIVTTEMSIFAAFCRFSWTIKFADLLGLMRLLLGGFECKSSAGPAKKIFHSNSSSSFVTCKCMLTSI